MKATITFTRYFGFFILLIGIILNIKMYFFNERPTYMFYILCFFGVLLIGTSYLMRQKK
jgi:galactitol-specific phosphotransferase system IIC component